MVLSDEALPTQDAVAEVQQLRQQLLLRDQLVDQLSFELFQAMRAHPPALPAASGSVLVPPTDIPAPPPKPSPLPPAATPEQLADQVQVLEKQVAFYQQQIDQRDTEINRLQRSCQSLSDRNHVLEHVIQELPDVYREKFTDRLDQVKHKMQSLKQENQRLQSQLQGSPSPSTKPRGLARRLLPPWVQKSKS